MPLLTRYVLAELLKVFVVVLAAMTLFMVFFGVGKEAISQGLGVAQIIRILPYILPEALRFAVPGTILFAVCSVYGRMSSFNEVVAIKSLGISAMAILWPMFVLTFLLSLATVWLNDLAVSWGRPGVQRVIIESVEEIAYGMLRTQKSYSTKQFSMNVWGVEGRKLIHPTLSFQPSGDSPAVTVTAEEAEMRSNPAENTLHILFRNGTMDVGGNVSISFPVDERRIPLSEASAKGDKSGSPSQLPLRVIPDEIVAQRRQMDEQEQRMAALAGYQMMTGDFAALTGSGWAQQQESLQAMRSRLFRLYTEPHRRWANGFSCLCFVVIGAPIAIRLRKAEFLTSFFLCFGPILLLYYPLLILGVNAAKSGDMPSYAVWLGNVILIAIGVWQLRKVARY